MNICMQVTDNSLLQTPQIKTQQKLLEIPVVQEMRIQNWECLIALSVSREFRWPIWNAYYRHTQNYAKQAGPRPV